jgi:pimeloyl-ACP methyl ester carboxylesterase
LSDDMLPLMMEAQCREFAEDVVYEEIENAGHWIPEERPEAFVKLLQGWFEEKGLSD